MTDDSVFGTDDAAAGSGSEAGSTQPTPGAGKTPESGATTGASSGTGGSSSSGTPSSSGALSSGGGAQPSGTGGLLTPTTPGPGVNSMIVDAVNQSNTAVLGSASQNGSAIAYQKVAQAAAFAVQDSTDYLRNIMAMSSAATGVALKKMVENPATAAQYTPVLTAAQGAVAAAQENFSAVGTAAGTVVSGFPSGS